MIDRQSRANWLLPVAVLLFMLARAPASVVVGPWAPIFKGVDHSASQMIADGSNPRNQVVHAIRVDLTDPDVQLFGTPPIANSVNNSRETAGQTTSQFLNGYQLQVAINGNFFSPCCGAVPGDPLDVSGLCISQGRMVSVQEDATDAAALLFTTNKQATFVPTNWPAVSTAGIYTAVCGHYPLVLNGVNMGNDATSPIPGANPRTAIGVSRDGRYLYLVTIDGRQPGYSDGAIDPETADWLLRFGAYNGIDMDGGGSTALVMADCSGKAMQINRPIDQNIPGSERVVANNLGIYAKASGAIADLRAIAGETTATIGWTTLSNSTSQVEYGLTSSYGNSSPLDSSLVTNHLVSLNGLLPGTNYFFRAISTVGTNQYLSACCFSTTNDTRMIFDVTKTWRYHTNNLDGIRWQAQTYDDSGWLGQGPGLLYIENNAAVAPRNTPLPGTSGALPATYYFRTHFLFTNATAGVSLMLSNFIDDGAVFYLNGVEIQRVRMLSPPAAIRYTNLTTAFPCQGDATCPDVFTISGALLTNLLTGDNVLAAEVHQSATNSSDIVFGSWLFFSRAPGQTNSPPALLAPASPTIDELTTLSVTNRATDPDFPNQQLTFSLISGPANATLSPVSGVFTWTPTEAQGPSTNPVTIKVTDNGTPPMSDQKTFIILVNEVNAPPVLAPIASQTVNERTPLILTAKASDPDLPANTLAFTLDPGAPAGAGINSATGVFSWTPTEAQGPGSYTIIVRVTDNGIPAMSDVKTFTATVNEVNTAPVLAGITNFVVEEGSLLTFTNSASDVDLPPNMLRFSLDFGPSPGAAVDPVSGVFTWTPDETQGGSTNTMTVRVTDNGSPPLSDARSFTVIVNEVNSPPVLGRISDRTVNELSLLTFTALASDPDLPAQALTFSLEAGSPAGALLDPTNGVFTWTPTEAQGPGIYTIIVRVTDNGSPAMSDVKTFTATVKEVNSAPVLAGLGDFTVNEGSLLTFTNSASDADLPANTLLFSLDPGAPAGATVDSVSGVFTWTPDETQGGATNTITVRVTDNGSPPLSDARNFTVIANEVNSPPVLGKVADRMVNELSLLTFTALASDPDLPAQTLTFSLNADTPGGALIDAATGVFTWTPTEAQGPGVYHVDVIVTDNGVPPLIATQTLTILVMEVNSPPVLGPLDSQTINEENLLSFVVTASDPDLPANTLTFSLDPDAPTGATIDSVTGLFSWTPTEAQGPITTQFSIRVTDNGSPPLSDVKLITIVVNEVNQPPAVLPIGGKTVDEVSLLAFTVSATDADLPPQKLSFSLDAGFPAGSAIDPLTGVFTWTPNESQGGGSYLITIRVTDDGSPALSAAETISIFVNEINSPPSISAIAATNVNEGELLTFTVTATDQDLPAQMLTFSLDAGAPTNAFINPTNGVFTWTPTEAQGPSTNFMLLRVTDDGAPPLSAAQTFMVVVNEVNQPPVLTAITDQIVNAGQTLVLTLSATDADLPLQILSFSLDTPLFGASLDPTNGQFNWVAPAVAATTTNQIRFRVTDSGFPPLSDTAAIQVIVVAAPRFTSITTSETGVVTLQWQSQPGKTYRILSTTDLTSGPWSPLGEDFMATDSVTSRTDPAVLAKPRFYRIVQVD